MIDKAREAKLRMVQETAVDHAIQEMDAAADLGLESKESRGDRYWMTKMCAQSLTVAAKIESFMMLKNRQGFIEPGTEEDEAAAVDRMIKRARGEVASIIQRASSGLPKR